jgi:hypothetical protein
MKESAIEKAVTAHAKKLGWISLKLSGVHDKGKPDRMYLRQGVAVFVEYKAEGSRPTKLQESWLKKLGDCDFTATWVDSVDAGVKLFGNLTRRTP